MSKESRDNQFESAAFWLRSQPEPKDGAGWEALYKELARKQGLPEGVLPSIRPIDLPGYREHSVKLDAEMMDVLCCYVEREMLKTRRTSAQPGSKAP